MKRLACVFFSTYCLASVVAQEPITTSASASMRTLTFPVDRQVGVVELFSQSDLEARGDEVPDLIPAFGSVEVAANQAVSLEVGAVDDLRFLEHLQPTALQGLEIRGLKIGHQAIARITRFDELQSLSLDGCEIDSDAFDQAPTLSRLRRLTVSSEQNNKKHIDSLAGWISRLPDLDCLFATPALDAIAIQKLSGHPSLKAITIDVEKDRQAIIFKMISDLPALTDLVVSVDESVSPRALDRLASVPNLEVLTLVHAKVDGTLLENISRIGTLRNLRLLVITPGERFLAGLKSVQTLENLTLNMMPWDDAEARRQFDQQLPLTLLDLPDIKDLPDMRDLDAITLRRIFDMPKLESLHISGLAKGVDVDVLSGVSKLQRLKTLQLSFVPIDDDDLKMFSKMNSLEYLSLVHAKVTGTGFSHLKDLPSLNRLQIMMDTRSVQPDLGEIASLNHLNRIQIFGFGFEPEDYYPVADCHSLRHLALSEGTIDDSVAERISRLPALRRLHWPDSSITDQGVVALARMQPLQWVSVAGDISMTGVMEFTKLSNLSSLFVTTPNLSDADKRELPSLFPSVSKIGFRDKR